MTRPALVTIGIGAVLALGLNSCGTAGSAEDSDVVETGTGQDTADPTSPLAAAPDDADGDAATADGAADAATTGPDTPVTDGASGTSTLQNASPRASSSSQALPSPGAAGPVDGVGISQGAAFTTYTDRAMAITYDRQLVPEGATISLVRNHRMDSTSISVEVAGLLADHQYSAHVHMHTCGATGDDAGPAYRNDPNQGFASGPAGTGNEIWLELATGTQGSARSSTTVDWPIRPGAGHSLIIHADSPDTGDADGQPDAGQAGDRVGCFVLGRT